MLRAFVLVNTEIGQGVAVAQTLRGLPSVKTADATIGPYDVVVEAEVPDAKALGKLVYHDIHCVPGVTSTLSLLAIDV